MVAKKANMDNTYLKIMRKAEFAEMDDYMEPFGEIWTLVTPRLHKFRR